MTGLERRGSKLCSPNSIEYQWDFYLHFLPFSKHAYISGSFSHFCALITPAPYGYHSRRPAGVWQMNAERYGRWHAFGYSSFPLPVVLLSGWPKPKYGSAGSVRNGDPAVAF